MRFVPIGPEFAAAVSIPEPDGAVGPGSGQRPAVRGKGQGGYPAGACFEHEALAAREKARFGATTQGGIGISRVAVPAPSA